MGHSTPLHLLQELHRAGSQFAHTEQERRWHPAEERCQVPACKGPWDHRAPKAVMGTGFGPQHGLPVNTPVEAETWKAQDKSELKPRAVATGALPAAQGCCPGWWPPMV